MYKLLKWEVRSKYKFLLATLGILFAFNLWLLTLVRGNNGAAVGVAIMSAIVAMCIVAIDSSRTFTKSLKRDYRYLLFSLPRNGYQRIGANLIMAVVKLLIVIIFGGLLVLINGVYTTIVLGREEYTKFLKVIGKIKFEMFFTTILILAAYAALLILIYFSKIISKAVLKGIKFSGLINFIFFVATFGIIDEIRAFLERVFDYSFDIRFFTSLRESANTLDANDFHIEVSNISINVAGLIFTILAVILMFLAAGYVLDKDVDV